jgi:filamentous hemagglutinin
MINSQGAVTVSQGGKPGFSYLIETNVKFIDLDYYLGSSYFFDRIGFSPERDIRLLGDAFYETTIVNKAIFETTGKRYLNGATTEKEQMQILYDNSIKAMGDLNLSLGVALTQDQINNLKEDIVWYVEETVNGVNVLVPKVYLSKETLMALGDNQTEVSGGNGLHISALKVSNTGSIQSGGTLTIDTEELLNKSVVQDIKAVIQGDQVEIVSVNDIKNIGAKISGTNTLSLQSLSGNIENISTLLQQVKKIIIFSMIFLQHIKIHMSKRVSIIK